MTTTEDAEAIRATVEDLQPGLALVPHALAVRHIDTWHDRLDASDRADLRQIAVGLQDLKSQLVGAAPDARVIGETLARIGRQSLAAAQRADTDDTARAVQRIGSLLLHAGHALRGPRAAST